MKKHFFVKESDLWTKYKLSHITMNPEEEDDIEEPLDNNWQLKARKLQIRRWRKIKHQLA